MPKTSGIAVALLLLIYSLCCTETQAQLRQLYIDDIQPQNEIKKISFYSANEGFVAFRDWIGFTTDTGRTFIKKYITENNVNTNGYPVNLIFGFTISGIKAFNANLLVVYGAYGNVPSILYSTNGGNTFSLVFHSIYNTDDLLTNPGITDIIFPQNNGTGYAIDQDRILKTTNGGLNWAILQTSPRSYFTHLEAVSNDVVWVLCTGSSSNQLLKTTNGNSFLQVSLPNVPAEGKLIYASFLDQNTGWLGMRNNEQQLSFYKTTNGGSNWTKQNRSDQTGFGGFKMKFINDSTGYAIGGIFNIFKTTNSGINWEPLPRTSNFTYFGNTHRDLQIYAGTQLWAGGSHGLLEVNTNMAGRTLPVASFEVDTLSTPGTVQLKNFSKNTYQYEWFVNGILTAGTYNAFYLHDYLRPFDTIQLVVNNGQVTDTATIIQHFQIPSPPLPDIISFSPTDIVTGSEVTITGTNFNGTNKVTFGGTDALSFTILSPSTIKATVGRGSTGYVKVTTPFGSDSAYRVIHYSPVISSITPAVGGFNTVVAIKGKNFTGTGWTNVTVGGVPIDIIPPIQDTLITGIVKYAVSDSVSVRTLYGTDVLTGFMYVPLAPGIISFSPTAAKPGDTITITGVRFDNVNSVKLAGMPAAFIRLSPNTIKAIVGQGAGISGFVTVYTATGSSTLDGFSYINPVIHSFAPTYGVAGSVIEIRGNNFNNVSAISVAGVQAASFTVHSATRITATLGNGSFNNTGNVTVITNTGSATRSGFLPATAPVILSVSPVSGPVGTTVTIKGLNFNTTAANNMVNFGAAKAPVTSASANTLIVTVPAGATYQPITVTSGNLTSTSVFSFLTTYAAKQITKNSFATKSKHTLKNVPFAVSVMDIDNDGKTDIIAVHNDTISIFRNLSIRGSVVFAPKTEIPFVSGGVKNTTLLIADMNGDGKNDIAFMTASGISVLRNTSTVGLISFAPPQLQAVTIPVSFGSRPRIIGGDLNSDGKPDILVGGAQTGTVYFKNNSVAGSLAFGPAVTLPSVGLGKDAVLTDLDADTKPEIIVVGAFNNSAFGYFKNSSTADSISFTGPVLAGTSADYVSVLTADMNNDNIPDVVTGVNNSTIHIYKNTLKADTASFGTAEIITIVTGTMSPEIIALGSINGDDTLDVFASGIYQTERIVQNIGSSVSPYFRQVQFSYNSSSGVRLADIDGDGKTDIVSGLKDSAFFIVHRNTATEPVTACPGGSSILVSNESGSSFQWEQSTDGINFTTITNGTNFSGTNNDTLTISGIPGNFANVRFRCLVNGMKYSEVLKLGFLNKWTGAVSNAWETAANWSCGRVPDKLTDVVIAAGIVTINSIDSARSIIIIPGATLNVTTNGRLVIFGNNNGGEYPGFSPVRTEAVSFVNNTSATTGGSVSNDFPGTVITEKGVVWDIAPEPTTALATKINSGSGTSGYVAVLNGLLPNTTYYARAYAITTNGTAYGEQVVFTTTGLPKATTDSIVSITYTSARLNGTITDNGDDIVTAAGFVWNTSPNPTTALSTKTIIPVNAGPFTSTIALDADKNYYVRAYVTNSTGTSYGKEITFFTPDSTAYKGIGIGNQVWMSKNLNVSRFRNGDPIPKVMGNNWHLVTTPAWKWFNDDSVTYSGYGKLYNWYAVSDPRGLAPDGWHIPGVAEFDSLANSVQDCGGCLKAIGTAYWLSPNTAANNITGFGALPAGSTATSGFINQRAYFWAKDNYNTTTGRGAKLTYDSNGFFMEYFLKTMGASVRCVQD